VSRHRGPDPRPVAYASAGVGTVAGWWLLDTPWLVAVGIFAIAALLIRNGAVR